MFNVGRDRGVHRSGNGWNRIKSDDNDVGYLINGSLRRDPASGPSQLIDQNHCLYQRG